MGERVLCFATRARVHMRDDDREVHEVFYWVHRQPGPRPRVVRLVVERVDVEVLWQGGWARAETRIEKREA